MKLQSQSLTQITQNSKLKKQLSCNSVWDACSQLDKDNNDDTISLKEHNLSQYTEDLEQRSNFFNFNSGRPPLSKLGSQYSGIYSKFGKSSKSGGSKLGRSMNTSYKNINLSQYTEDIDLESQLQRIQDASSKNRDLS